MRTTRAFRLVQRTKLGVGCFFALLLVGCDESPSISDPGPEPPADLFEVLVVNDTAFDLLIWAEVDQVRVRLGSVGAWTSEYFDISEMVDRGPVQLSAAGGDGNTLVLGPMVGRGDGQRDHTWTVSGRDLP